MQHLRSAFSGRPGRVVRLAAAGLTTAALTVGAGTLSPSAVAGGDHHDEDPAVVIGLTDTTVARLTRGDNGIRALGAADKDTREGAVVVSFPVRDGDKSGEQGRRYGGDHDGSEVVRLAGALAVLGEGADATWSALRLDLDEGSISAVVNGADRAKVLTVDRDEQDGHYRGGDHGSGLELTRVGARSLNRAVVGAPFEAGDTFAGDSEGCR